jgi:hypothetical protein
MHFSIYALALSILAMVVASLMTAKNSETILDNTRTGWYVQSPGPSPRVTGQGSPGLLVDQESPRRQ